MNEEMLRALAREHGFYLLRAEKYEKMLPCSCGGKKRKRTYINDGVQAVCCKCGKTTPVCKSEADLRHTWNELIREETTNGSESRKEV